MTNLRKKDPGQNDFRDRKIWCQFLFSDFEFQWEFPDTGGLNPLVSGNFHWNSKLENKKKKPEDTGATRRPTVPVPLSGGVPYGTNAAINPAL